MALELYELLLCRCGCGQLAAESHDPATEGQWVMVDDDAPVCFARAAITQWQDEEPKLEPGVLPYVRRLTPAERAARGFDED